MDKEDERRVKLFVIDEMIADVDGAMPDTPEYDRFAVLRAMYIRVRDRQNNFPSPLLVPLEIVEAVIEETDDKVAKRLSGS
ncbi:MAG: hypothetical protein ACOYL5_17185 [Phototrophicaceae bacterium]